MIGSFNGSINVPGYIIMVNSVSKYIVRLALGNLTVWPP